jgi:hypothetical protein
MHEGDCVVSPRGLRREAARIAVQLGVTDSAR